MASVLPATGVTITLGRVRNAYNMGGAISLSAHLAGQAGRAPGTPITLSSTFGGKTAPGAY